MQIKQPRASSRWTLNTRATWQWSNAMANWSQMCLPAFTPGEPADSSSRRIVLDLSDLTHIDSMGLGTLVRLYVSSRSAGCSLELINLGKRVRELLGLTHLLSVFTVIGEHGGMIRLDCGASVCIQP